MPSSDAIPEHIRRPHLRPIQPIGVRDKSGNPMVALRDPAMLTQQTMVVPVGVMQVLQLFRGDLDIEEVATQIKAEVEQLIGLAEGLDKVGLLWGPTFEQMENEARQRLQDEGSFPVRASASLGDEPDVCRAVLESFFEQAEDPEIDEAVVGIVAPHLDYDRGWPNYAAAYYALRETPAPDRVVVFGANHFGIGDGVVLTEYGFRTPMGCCPVDDAVVNGLVARLDKAVTYDQLDHLGEHSIELQLPWLQYCWGDVPIVAALMPDPLADMIADDGERTSPEQFIPALRDVLDEVGGRTFVVASADLSHVGPQFGEPKPVDDQRRFDVERHDREMMGKFLGGDAEEFIAAMKWNKNPTRWCSVGTLAATLDICRPSSVELIDYRQAYDEQGAALVTSAAMVLT